MLLNVSEIFLFEFFEFFENLTLSKNSKLKTMMYLHVQPNLRQRCFQRCCGVDDCDGNNVLIEESVWPAGAAVDGVF